MEAQICQLLMSFCNRKLVSIYDEMNTKLIGDIRFRTIDETNPEPWLRFAYTNPYHTTLRDTVLVLRRLYSYW
jgi:hypothetical protein